MMANSFVHISSQKSRSTYNKERRLDKVIFASDCLSLIQRLQSSSLDRSVVGILVGEIKSLVDVFREVSFTQVKRNLNVAAHCSGLRPGNFLY